MDSPGAPLTPGTPRGSGGLLLPLNLGVPVVPILQVFPSFLADLSLQGVPFSHVDRCVLFSHETRGFPGIPGGPCNMNCWVPGLSLWKPREHEGTERKTEGVGCDYVIVTKVIFSFRKSVFRDVRMWIRKANFNDNGGFVVGMPKHFRGDTRGLCFSWYTRDLCSQVTQRTNKSYFVVVYVTIQSWLWLAVCKWCKIQEIHIFKLNKIYLHSRHYFTSSNCIVMQLQGIVFIQLQENDILVNWQGNIDSFKAHIFIHKKHNHSR